MLNDLKENRPRISPLTAPGKFEISPTQPLATQRDLALAYSSGVSAACEAIVTDRTKAVHIVTPTATVRRLVNMMALAVVDAQSPR